VSTPDIDIAPGQLWFDLRAARRNPARRRILLILAMPLPHALVRVFSDTHPMPNQPRVRRISTSYMRGGPGAERCYQLIGTRPAA
jgi:hypothetical protein